MVKNHLKRLSTPKTWLIQRKENKYITRPTSTGQALYYTMPILVVLKEFIKVGKTSREIKHILNNNEILVNNKRRTEPKFGVGLFDVIDIKPLGESYRIVLNKRNQLVTIKIPSAEKNTMLLKITKKYVAKGKKLCLNFNNGFNLSVDNTGYSVGDVVVYDSSSNKIKELLKLEKGCHVYFTGGKYVGLTVTVEDIQSNEIIFKTGSSDIFRTSLCNAFVVGKDKPVIAIEQKEE